MYALEGRENALRRRYKQLVVHSSQCAREGVDWEVTMQRGLQGGGIHFPRMLLPWVFLIPAVLLWLGGVACDREKPPIKVGFSGGLTGKFSDLGTAGRNGVTLAVEELNAAGGIHGRRVELITRDDRQEPDAAVQADRELIDEGVAAIIGHMTSVMSMAAQPLINEKKMLMISPTTSTARLNGLDDYFIRVVQTIGVNAGILAEHVYTVSGVRNVGVIYDLSNRAFTEDYVSGFRSRFEDLGGRISAVETFQSGPGAAFPELVQKTLSSGAEGLVIAASAVDAAMICQQMRKTGSGLPVFLSGWAMTQDFLQHGGTAVAGASFIEFFDRESTLPSYLDFKNRFIERFGEEPSFAAVFGYEAAQVLFAALARNEDVGALRETILRQKTFRGVQGDFEIDAYGDAKRTHVPITVKDGRFTSMERDGA